MIHALYDEDGSHSLFVALFEPPPSDACAGLAKKTCKKTAGCAYKKKTCSTSGGDACSGLVADTTCKYVPNKKKCKKAGCRWNKKKEKCLAKK